MYTVKNILMLLLHFLQTMPYKCSVPHCRGNYDADNKVTAFKFPHDENLKSQWMNKISREDFQITKNSRVSRGILIM